MSGTPKKRPPQDEAISPSKVLSEELKGYAHIEGMIVQLSDIKKQRGTDNRIYLKEKYQMANKPFDLLASQSDSMLTSQISTRSGNQFFSGTAMCTRTSGISKFNFS